MGQAFQLRGGIKLAPRKEPATQSSFEVASTPAEIVLPLEQHDGSTARASVKAGEYVRIGQLVAEPADSFGSHLHAPVSGKVVAIESRAHRDATAPSIVIVND